MLNTINQVRKFVVALLGLAALAVQQGLMTGTAAKWVGIAIGVATAIGVFAVPNVPSGKSNVAPPLG